MQESTPTHDETAKLSDLSRLPNLDPLAQDIVARLSHGEKDFAGVLELLRHQTDWQLPLSTAVPAKPAGELGSRG